MQQELRLVLIVICVSSIILLLVNAIWIEYKERAWLVLGQKVKHSGADRKKIQSKNLEMQPPDFRMRKSRQQDALFLNNSNTSNRQSLTGIKFGQLELNNKLMINSAFLDGTGQNSEENTKKQSYSVFDQDRCRNYLLENERLKSVPVFKNKSIYQNQKKVNSMLVGSDLILEKQKEIIFILHVVAHKKGIIRGGLLLNSILRVGFKFGEKSIFHFHTDSSCSSNALFSLANMVKPGFFKLDTMLNFTTPGVSLFMMAPSYGDTYKNFKLMLQSAQRIAKDISGMVLDDKHRIITPQKIETYRIRIHELIKNLEASN